MIQAVAGCDYLALAVEGVQGIQAYQPGKPIEEVERELGLVDVIKLASNENPLGPGAAAREAARACIDGLGRYPDGNGFALKAKLAAHHGVSPDMLTVGNGSNDLLELVTRAYVAPASEVVYSAHAFAVYGLVTQAAGACAVETPARDWGHDLDAMAAAITDRTRLVFIANPNNPTGTWVGAEALHSFLSGVPENVLVLVDEAYHEYVNKPDYGSCLDWVAERPNLIVTRTFSKAHGLAGLRVGYGVSNPVIADVLNRVRQPFNVNLPALAAAAAALDDTAHVARSREVNEAGIAALEAGLRELGLGHVPTAGNFIAVDLGRPGGPVCDGLMREGVIVRPVAGYGMPNHLRVSVGLAQENARFLTALARVLGDD